MTFFSFVFVFMRYCSMFVVVELRGLLAWYFPLKLMAFFFFVFVFMLYSSVFVVVELRGLLAWYFPLKFMAFYSVFLYLCVIVV